MHKHGFKNAWFSLFNVHLSISDTASIFGYMSDGRERRLYSQLWLVRTSDFSSNTWKTRVVNLNLEISLKYLGLICVFWVLLVLWTGWQKVSGTWGGHNVTCIPAGGKEILSESWMIDLTEQHIFFKCLSKIVLEIMKQSTSRQKKIITQIRWVKF